MSTVTHVVPHRRGGRGRLPWPFKVGIAVAVVAAMIGMVVAQGTMGPKGPKRSPAGLPVETIRVSGESFETEVAADAASRMKGLGGRTTIGKNEAMIFVFPVSGPLGFWMKGCLMDIDIAFLDRAGVVTAVHAMKAEPPRGADESEQAYEARLQRYLSEKDALYAYEFAPGTIERLGIKPGQTIQLDHGKLRSYLH